MANSYGCGAALCNYPVSGSSGTDVKMLEGPYAPYTAFIQAVLWDGIGTLTLKTNNGYTFYSVSQVSGSSVPVPILSSIPGLTVTTPVLYTISGAYKGTVLLFGHFI